MSDQTPQTQQRQAAILNDLKQEWFVWSFEHNAWWGPNRGGYYTEIHAAGLYTEAEAAEIVRSANHGGQRNEEARHISTQAEHIRYAAERYRLLEAALNGNGARCEE